MLLLAYLKSGSTLSREIYNDFLKICEQGSLDIRGEIKVKRSCVESHIGEILLKNVVNMPSLWVYLSSLSQATLGYYGNSLLAASVSKNSSKTWVEKAELDVVGVVAHYSESIMTRFNINGDNYLQREEVNAAIPLFAGFIREMGKKLCMDSMDDQRVIDVFRHIVETGEIPQSKGWIHNWQLYQEFKRRRKQSWNPQFDRVHITSVLAAIIGDFMGSLSNSGHLQRQCN